MGRRYSIDGRDTNTDNTTLLTLVSAATIRPRIYDILIGTHVTPADGAGGFELQRFTAAGTAGATVVAQALDPADPAALATSGEAHSVEPTYTAAAILLYIPINQRATFRWVAVPGGELICPATAANGIGVQADTPVGAVSYDACIHFEE